MLNSTSKFIYKFLILTNILKFLIILTIFDKPVYLIINSEYSNIKKLKAKIVYLLLRKLFFDFFFISRNEHSKDINGI